MYFSNFFALVLLFGTLLSEGKGHSSNIYHQIEVRSHGCGRNPLLLILKQTTADNSITVEQVLNILDEYKDIREDVIEMIKLYDDCIRTADGMRYKKSQKAELIEDYEAIYKKVSEALQ